MGEKLKIQGLKERTPGKHGLTLSCSLQNKYNKERKNKIKGSSITLHTKLSPKEVINAIKSVIPKLFGDKK